MLLTSLCEWAQKSLTVVTPENGSSLPGFLASPIRQAPA